MSLVAGCDVGSLTAKAVILKRGKIVGRSVIKSKPRPEASAEAVMNAALAEAGCFLAEIAYCVGTGYGREKIPFVQEAVSEITCHARGARRLWPAVETVIDIGGQDCKAMKLDRDGTVIRFTTNDKCASGTGRFLEVMADVLGVELDELGGMTARAESPITLASTCTVWAQADVIKRLNSGESLEDIGAGINTAMAQRAAILIGSVGPEGEVLMTGGVAKNVGVVSTLETLIGRRIRKSRKADPQLAGALGAALIAWDRAGSEERTG